MMPQNVHVLRQWPIGVRYRLEAQSHLESRPLAARLYSPVKDCYAVMKSVTSVYMARKLFMAHLITIGAACTVHMAGSNSPS